MSFVVELKKASASAKLTETILARFDARPSWGDLASKIAEEFSISSNNLGVVFLDEVDGKITLKNEQELQSFYEAFDPSSGKIKFVVQDLQTPDSPKTISSTWSASYKADDNLTLFCWVFNISNGPFPVDIGERMTVGHLKEAIKKKKEHTFGAIDPDTLELWKLSLPIPSAEIGIKLRDAPSPQQIQGCVKLDPIDKLSKHFSLAPHNRLHVIVEAPPTPSLKPPRSPSAQGDGEAKKKRATSHYEVQKLPSEHSLHKLWMLAREPQSTLFETRPVQRDKTTDTNLSPHCIVLRGGDWIRKLQPDANFTGILIRDEYVEALGAIMNCFLAINKVTDDAMEVDDTEPAPFKNPFLDVPLGFVSTSRAFILLGDSGSGKTALLYVLLILRLQARLPTIYQSRKSHLYYFADDGVSLIKLTRDTIDEDLESQFHQSTWCLIDSNQILDTVPALIQHLGLFIVQASSPCPHRYAWANKTTRPVSRHIMKPWTLPELLVGRVLQDNVFSEAQIEFFSTRYGTSARSVYVNALHPLKYERSLTRKMAMVSYEEMARLFRGTSHWNLAEYVSNQLVSISPGATRNAVQSTFPTRYIYELLLDNFANHKLEAVARLYDAFLQTPYTRVSAGFMLEDAVNDVFFRGGEWSLVPLMKSNRTGPKYTHWKYPNGPITPQYLHLGHPGRHIAIDTTPDPVGTVYEALPLKRFLPGGPLQLVDGYYCPSSRSQETFDAFIYESTSKTATLLQVTTAKFHSVKEGGVKWLQGLGVERFRYIAVSTPNTPIGLSFPNGWNTSTGPSIPEKYLLTVESLPQR